jgi:hypothetical protein
VATALARCRMTNDQLSLHVAWYRVQRTELAEAGAAEAVERYLINSHVAAKGVQLRLLRQRVVMSAQRQRPQAGVLLDII